MKLIASQRGAVMSEHKFKIGERLFPACSVGLDASKGAYVVVKRLPKHNGEFEYQIKSASEIDERIVRESQIETESVAKPNRTTL
jgi:hypothetical protein